MGSLAVDGGDRYSDLDLTFSVADHVPVADVLGDWTCRLIDDFDAVHLTDLERSPTIYRVLLLPDALQFDLSMTPAARFRPRGPRFRLLFGETTAGESDPPNLRSRKDLFGWGVIYALHARACIERGRVWQAEHYVGPCGIMRSRSHASTTDTTQCRPAATATFLQRRWPNSTPPTLARWSRSRSGRLWPPRFTRS